MDCTNISVGTSRDVFSESREKRSQTQCRGNHGRNHLLDQVLMYLPFKLIHRYLGKLRSLSIELGCLDPAIYRAVWVC